MEEDCQLAKILQRSFLLCSIVHYLRRITIRYSEIEELLGRLKDCDPKEKEPRDSIMLGPKYRPQEFINAHSEGQQLKINLLDMDAARLRVAVRPSNMHSWTEDRPGVHLSNLQRLYIR
ncbi:hypothetical protein P8452_54438 [Trifolium repens]|nr:hypothetical protein P8452_54438 [Trifolium repens]